MIASPPVPLVSVVMPVFNSARFLSAAIESILAQTLAEFELIIVDDGSTDDSVAIAERFARRDARVRLFRNPHLGLSRIRNRGFKLARAEFVATMDSDDVALPQRLLLEQAYLATHAECAVVGGQAEQMDADGCPIAPLHVDLYHARIEAQLLQGRGSALIQSSAMFRRRTVLSAGGYDERLQIGEDLDLYLRLAERSVLANLPEVVLRIRRHPASLSAGYDADAARRDRQDVIRRTFWRRGWDQRQVSVRQFFQPRTATDIYATWIVAAFRAGNYRTAGKYLRLLARESTLRPASTARGVCGFLRRAGGHWLNGAARTLVFRSRRE